MYKEGLTVIAYCRNLAFLIHRRQIFPAEVEKRSAYLKVRISVRDLIFSLLPPLLTEEVEFMGKVGMRVRHNKEISM